MTDERWTASRVEERLAEAADVLRRLPEERVQGYGSTWPAYVHDPGEAYGWDRPRLRPIPPTPRAIDRMEETLTWLRWLEPEVAKLVWARAKGERWKVICWRFGLGRTTAWERWVMGLCVIALRLNGERASRHSARLQRPTRRRRRG